MALLAEEKASQLVFSQAYQGLFGVALRSRMTPACRDRLVQELGLDPGGPFLPAYPFQGWLSAIGIAAEELFGPLPVAQAWHQMGRLLVTGYRETALGSALFALSRVLGPRRSLLRMTQNFRSGCNYLDTRVQELGPTCLELWVNEVGPHPEFTQGTLAAGLEVSGASAPRVTILRHDGHAALYQVSWL